MESSVFFSIPTEGKGGYSSSNDNRTVASGNKEQKKHKTKEKKHCSHCNKDDHNVDGSFEIVGYLD